MNDAFILALVRASCADGSARRLREAARLSLRDVALACDVNIATASRWERGHCFPQRAAALRFGRFLQALENVVEEA